VKNIKAENIKVGSR